MPQTGTGYVNLSNYLDANRDTLGNEATQLINTDTNAANAAKQQADKDIAAGTGGMADFANARGNLANAYTNLQGLGNQGGLQDQLQSQYHEAPGQAGFDAALLGNSQASGALKGAAGGFEGLSGYLDSQLAAQQAAPPGPPRRPQPVNDEPNAPTTPGKVHYQTEDEPRQPQGRRGGGL